MKLRFFPILFLFSSSVGLAAFNEALTIKKVSEDGYQFVFVRKEGAPPWNGITIKDPSTKATLYEAKVTKCNATACIGIVVRNQSGMRLRVDEEYVHSYNEKPIQYDPEKAPKVEEAKKPELKEPEPVAPVAPVPPPEPVKPKVEEFKQDAIVDQKDEPEPPKPEPKVEPKPEPKPEPPKPVVEKPKPTPKPKAAEAKVEEKEPEKPSAMDRMMYAAYGSPIGPGFKLGYMKKVHNLILGVNYAKIGSSTNNVSIDGHLLSFGALMNVMNPTPSTEINLLGEIGLAKATLDFSAIDEDGPTKDESTYFVALGGEGKLNFDRLSVALRSGVGKAGFGTTYEGQLNAYNNPYASVLVFLEIGVYYRF